MSEKLGNPKAMIPHTLPTRSKLCYIPNRNTASDLNTNYIDFNDYFTNFNATEYNINFNTTEYNNFNATDFHFNAMDFPDFDHDYSSTNMSDFDFPWNICPELKAKHLAFLHFLIIFFEQSGNMQHINHRGQNITKIDGILGAINKLCKELF